MTDREAIDVLINEWKCIARNDGIHCDRKCESCDLVMDVEVIREAYSMAISALQAQEAKNSNESSLTQKGLDTISRQAAIDAIVKWAESNNENPDGDDCIMIILELPSAQPEIVRCKDCKYGEQDEVGRWFCRSLGCQIGDEDGSGFCADAERRTDG